MNIVSLLGYPQKGVLREDVECSGFVPLGCVPVDISQLNENTSEAADVRVNQILDMGLSLCQFVSLFFLCLHNREFSSPKNLI